MKARDVLLHSPARPYRRQSTSVTVPLTSLRKRGSYPCDITRPARALCSSTTCVVPCEPYICRACVTPASIVRRLTRLVVERSSPLYCHCLRCRCRLKGNK